VDVEDPERQTAPENGDDDEKAEREERAQEGRIRQTEEEEAE